MREMGLDMNLIYVKRPGFNSEGRPGASEDGTVIDLQRYKILRTMRKVLDSR